MSLGNRIARNTVVQFAGKGVTTILGLALLAFLTRKLGVAQYGEYITVLTFSQFFGIFANFGIDVYVLKRLSTPHEGERTLVAEAFSLRLVTGLAVMALAWGAAWFFPYAPYIKVAIGIALVSVLAQTLNSYFVTILQARLQMRFAVFTEIIGRILTLGFSVGLVLAGKGLFWVIAAQAIGAVVNLGLTMIFASRIVPITIKWSKAAWGVILKEAIPISISAMLGYLYFKLDTIFLSTLPISGGRTNEVEVGIYGSAYKVLEILLLVPAIFLGSVFPVMSNFLQTKDNRVGMLLQRSLEVMAVFGFPVTVLLLVAAPQIIQFVAGSQFMAAVLPLRILSLAILVNYFSTVFTYTALTLNKQVSLIKIYALAAVVNALSNYFLIPIYSYEAAAWTTLVTEVIILILPYLVCVRELKFKVEFGKMARMGLAALILGVVFWYMRNLSLWPILIVGAVVYVALLGALKAIAKKDFLMLLRGNV